MLSSVCLLYRSLVEKRKAGAWHKVSLCMSRSGMPVPNVIFDNRTKVKSITRTPVAFLEL
jgi:hypothetical protein